MVIVCRGAPDLDPDPAGYPVDLVDPVWIRIRPDPASPDPVRIRIRPDPTLDPAGSKSFIYRLPWQYIKHQKTLACQYLPVDMIL